MNLPQVYMCSPSWTLLPPPTPFPPSGSSQCTSPKHPVSCIEPGLATRFILYTFVRAFLLRSKHLLISWQQSPSAMNLEPKKIKSVTASTFPFYLPWNYGTGCHDLSFWMLSFKPTFSLSSFTLIKRIFSFSLISAIRVISAASQVVDIWPNNLDSSLSFINYAILHDVLFI